MLVLEGMLLPVVYSLMNIGSVVAIVMVNKSVFQISGFHFPTLLVCIHCGVTHIGLRIASSFGVFERKSFPTKSLVILACSFIGYNVASLANLSINTVGFYQISKIMATPSTMILEAVWLGKSFPKEMLYAVLVMCIGVALATVTDFTVTFVGGITATVAAFGAAQSYIFIGKTQKDLGASSNQLLLAYTPYCFILLLLLSPIDTLLPNPNGLEDNAIDWFNNKATAAKVALVLFSGCIGLLVSLTTFLLIKATSALTYNIVGHAKTICILISGVMIFGDEITQKKFLGIVVALTGMVWYGQIKLTLRKSPKSTESSKKPTSRPQSIEMNRPSTPVLSSMEAGTSARK
ncbi:hypothetical protein AAMO2058_001598700 [Amorphochlora amoebiformis]